MFWTNFSTLCADKNLSPNAVAMELKIPSGSITAWRNGATPRTKSLTKIANYFGVTVDYLLNAEKENPTSVTADGVDELDKEALDIMHQLPPEKRAAGLAMLRGLLNN
jgi:transcriptional regulator with XRE-family HTH domain|uniref:Repressor protein CI n=1 Tax=Ackermannviridae sp. TaxID=2831612 RepID=A0A8S5VPL5_9CAUD|nr:MAG TPA: Repressor protein CI [Ackermannviridae sp.]